MDRSAESLQMWGGGDFPLLGFGPFKAAGRESTGAPCSDAGGEGEMVEGRELTLPIHGEARLGKRQGHEDLPLWLQWRCKGLVVCIRAVNVRVHEVE